MRSHVDFLSSLGFYALAFDPPGTWKSSGDISTYNTTNTLKAIDEIIEYHSNKPTLLVGHSRGGSNAMLAGTRNSAVTRFVSVMSRAGPTSVGMPQNGAQVVESYRDVPSDIRSTDTQKRFLLPLNYFKDQAMYDPLDDLRHCAKPKLFFYGTRDPIVTESDVQRAFTAASEPKMIHELDSDHNYRVHPPVISEVNRVIGVFLELYPTV